MGRVWRAIGRAIFWSYERGSWPYDVMCGLILLFVLLTPRGWFHDRPQTGLLASGLVQLIMEDSTAGTQTYRVDAKAFRPEKRATRATPELERETHDFLSRTADDLKGQPFQVLRIDPVFTGDGSVATYDVTIKR
jgi:hypothetical protein